MKTKLIKVALTSVLALGASVSLSAQGKKIEGKKAKVVALLKSIETGDTKPVSYVNAERYTQHNLSVEDGLEGFGKALAALNGTGRVNTVRVLQDGDYVVAHTDYEFFGPKVGFDIFRFEKGKIVEHWDNLQTKPEGTNPSGRTMLDGTTTIKDRKKTKANKRLVQSFVEDILRDGKMDKIGEYIVSNHYIQHNPAIADGLDGLGAALEAMAKQGITMRYDRIHKVLGEGNFVLVVSEGAFAGKPTSFYDLFRVENGKIVEHWDTIEEILPNAEHKHGNGKFGFAK